MSIQNNSRGIVVSKLTKDIEHLLTAGTAKNVKVRSWILQHENDREGDNFSRGDLLVGRSGRLYSKQKIADFASGKKPQVMLKISTYRKTTADLKNHLSYITRKGKVPLEDQNGNPIVGKEERAEIAEQWHDMELMKVTAKAKYLGKKVDDFTYPRVAASIVLSMPAGTDRNRFMVAVREYASEQFAEKGYEYLLAFHHDTRHPHAHLLLRLRNIETNRKLNPGKADIKAWRDALQEKMTEHGLHVLSIPARLRGLMASENSIGVHMDMRDARKALREQGVEEIHIQSLLEGMDKNKAKEFLNRQSILTRRQQNLRASVKAALDDPKAQARLQAFTEARQEERAALKMAIGNVAKDISAASPEYAGLLVQYARQLPDERPELMKILTEIGKDVVKGLEK